MQEAMVSLVRPLGILDDASASLTDAEIEKLRRIETAEFPYVREKLLKDGKISPDEIGEVEFEFKRYLGLIALDIKPLGMISRKVDEFWHQFILFTRLYAKFCDNVMGFFVHHMPRTSYTPLAVNGAESFIRAYEACYGELSPVWDRNMQAECPDSTPSGWGDPNPPDDD